MKIGILPDIYVMVDDFFKELYQEIKNV